jgi:hypothetical protein
MREFADLASFVIFLATRAAAVEIAAAHGLDIAGRIIKAEAQNEIGIPQGKAGPFDAWAPLAESTMEEKTRLGFTKQRSAEDPLLRTGELRDSIGHHIEGHEVAVGSDSEIAVYQELGTATIPPRSFLGGAAVRKTDEAVNAVVQEVVLAIAGTTARPNRWT